MEPMGLLFLSPGSVPDVGAEFLWLPGVVLLCLICIGFLYSFMLPVFHFSTELHHCGFGSLLENL